MAYFRCTRCDLKFEPHCKPCQTAPSSRCPKCGALAYPVTGQPPHHGEPAAQQKSNPTPQYSDEGGGFWPDEVVK